MARPEDQPAPFDSVPGDGGAGGRVELAPGVRVDGSVLRFTYSRSGGPGGQNVNKRETRAQLRLAIDELPVSNPVRERLARRAGSLVTSSGELVISSDEHRSQRRNRDACLRRLRVLLIEAQKRPTPRRPTRPTRGSIERRLQAKRERGERKRTRRPPDAP